MSPTRDPPSILGEEFLFFPSEEQIHFSCQLTVEFQRGINVDDLECSLSRSLDERLVSTQGRKLQVARSFLGRAHAVSYTHLTLPTIYSV